MKPNAFSRSLLLAIGSSMLAISSASAQQLYWDSNGATAGFGTTTGIWGTSTFWSTSSAGTAATANTTTTSSHTVNFGTATLNYGNGSVGIASGGVTVGSIVIGGGQTTALTIGTAGNSLTIHNGITKNAGSAAVTFLSPITLGAAQTWTNDSSTSINLSGGNTVNNNGHLWTLQSGVFDFAASTAVTISGSGGLTLDGARLIGAKSGATTTHLNYTGTTTIQNGGSLLLHTTGTAPSGNITINGGYLDAYFGGAFTPFTRNLGSGDGQLRITGGVSGFSGNGDTAATVTLNNNAAFEVVWGSTHFNPTKLLLQAGTAQGNSSLTFANLVDLNGANRTVTVSGGTTGGASATLSNTIRTSSGTAGLIKEGTGQLILSGSNTYNGTTTVSEGILTATTTSGITGWGSAGNISVASGATLGVRTSGTGAWTAADIDTLRGNVTWASNSAALGIDVNSGTFSYASDVNGAHSLMKYGTGILNLNGDLSGLGGSIILANGTLGRSSGILNASSIEVRNGTLSANIGGTTAVTKTTAGVVTLSGTNTYSGGFTLNAGQVQGLAAGAYSGFGSGTLTITGGNIHMAGHNGTTTIANALDLSGSLILSRAGTGSPTIRFDGDAVLSGNFSATNSGSQPPVGIIFAGNISETAGPAKSLSLSGSTPFTLSGNNSFSGGLTLSSTLNINSATALGTGTFTISSGTIDNTSGNAIMLSNNNAQAWNANFTFTGSNDLNMGTGAVTINANRTVTTTAGTLTVGGNISGGFTLTKAGAGNLVLGGASTYSGVTTVQQGNLIAAANAPSGSAGAFGNATSEIVLGVASGNNAAGILTDGAYTIGRIIRNATTNATDAGTRVLTLGGNSAHNSEFSGNIFLGTTNNTSKGVQLTAAAGGQVTFSGVIQNPTGQDGTEQAAAAALDAVTKVGAGTVVLTGTNTYTGATSVTAGTLQVSGTGSINSSSAINVATGASFVYNSSTALAVAPTLNGNGLSNRAVLGGSGPINAALTLDNIGDVLSPGNSPGVQEFGVSQSWNSFSYDWEVNDWVAAVAGTNFDQISITGALNLTGSTGSYLLNILSLNGSNLAGDVGNFAETTKSWSILTASGGINDFNASYWTLNTDDFSSTPAWAGAWSLGLGNDGKDLVLTYTAIPEPRAALLGGIGLLLLLRRRRS
jgi:fibronectin-binding autotransporter adhesin